MCEVAVIPVMFVSEAHPRVVFLMYRWSLCQGLRHLSRGCLWTLWVDPLSPPSEDKHLYILTVMDGYSLPRGDSSDILWVVCEKTTTVWAPTKKLPFSWQFYGVPTYGSGWRKDFVNQCFELGTCPGGGFIPLVHSEVRSKHIKDSKERLFIMT